MNLLLIDSVDYPFGGLYNVHISLLDKGLNESGINAELVIPYGNIEESISRNGIKYGHFDGVPYYFVRDGRKLNKCIRFLDMFFGVGKKDSHISLINRNYED